MVVEIQRVKVLETSLFRAAVIIFVRDNPSRRGQPRSKVRCNRRDPDDEDEAKDGDDDEDEDMSRYVKISQDMSGYVKICQDISRYDIS